MARDRAFAISFGVSALFHLSMITLFSIGIWFQVTPTRYFSFSIIKPSVEEGDRGQLPGEPAREALRVPSLYDPLGARSDGDTLIEGNSAFKLARENGPWSDLPEVELPALQIADLDRLRLRKESIEIRTRHEELWGKSRQGSWAEYGQELARNALARLPFFEHAPPREEAKPQRVSVPAEGFEIYIEWMSEPKNRGLLFSPPIESLWKVEPSQLTEPILFVFRVSPDGRVREVLPGSVVDDAGLSVSVARALTNYRFAPLEGGDQRDQHGTLLISAARSHD